MRLVVFFALLTLLPLSGLAQTYKCVDERGLTSYSDKPRSGCKGSQVDIRPSAERAAFAARCASLRGEQARLSSGRRLVELNSSGERVYLPDDVRNQRVTNIAAALRGCP